MTQMRWTPYRELMTMHDQLNRLFDENYSRGSSGDVEYGAWAPAVDLREEDKRFVIEVDLPGVKKEDIQIQLENNLLTIRGERRFESETKKEHYHRIERAYGKFLRSFTLPTRVEAGKINATQRDGILEVVIPKAEESLPKKIEVKG
jgi:HSP20 family protein